MNPLSVDTQARLDVYLSEKTGKSRSFIQDEIKKGNITVNKQIINKPSHRVTPGDSVYYTFTEIRPESHLTPTPGHLDILFEDKFFLAVNKSAGVIVHPGAGQKENTLVHFLLHYLKKSPLSDLTNERPGIVHRLDQGTTGVILIAKDETTQQQLSSLFKERNIIKTYHAITWGKMSLSGTIDSPIGRDMKDRKKISSRTQKARMAVTHWKAIERFQHFTYVALQPKTGRTHQLRVHLSEFNFPIVGDPTYGRKKPKSSLVPETVQDNLKHITHTLLHAQSLEFTHPRTQQHISISAPLPPDFLTFLNILREHDS